MRRVIVLALAAAALLGANTAALAQGAVPYPGTSMPYGVSPIEDEAIHVHALMDRMEGRFGAAGNGFHWSGEAWAGTDTNRLWLKSEGNVAADGTVEDGQQELFYDRPISPWFDLQAGVRSDIDSAPGRTWAAFGIEGLAPYFFEVSATGYVSSEGHFAAKLEGSYDLLITQRLILQPQIEMNVYSKPDPARGLGTGLADLDTGLRLRYEFSRKFAPYIGMSFAQSFGGTANYARAAGERTSDLRFVFGVRAWL